MRNSCEKAPCAKDLADKIEHDYTYVGRQKYLNRLDGSEFNQTCAETLAATLADTLNLENAFYRKEAWKALQTLADAYPVVVSQQTQDILSAAASLEVDVWENVGEILFAVLEVGVELPVTPERRFVESLQEADQEVCRQVAIELYRRRATTSDLKALQDMVGYETHSLANQSKEAIEKLITDSLRELIPNEQSSLSTESAASNMRYAARNAADHLITETEQLFKLLGTENADVAIIALAEIASFDQPETGDIVGKLGEMVRINDATQSKKPDEQTEKIYRRAEDALESLIEAGQTGEVSSYVVSRADEWLESESVELNEHALTQLRVIAERDPAAIEHHIKTISEMASGEGSLAGEVLQQYGRTQSGDAITYLREVCGTHESGSMVGHLANAVGCLKYRRPGETTYSTIEVDPKTDKALANVADTIGEGRTMPAIWPQYEPRVCVLFALELALRQDKAGEDVVVFSPGGQRHWGNKSELRSEFRNYGLRMPDGMSTIPLPNLISHARIDDGSVKQMSEGSSDLSIVFSKDFDEIRSLDVIEMVVPNFSARTKERYEEALDQLVQENNQMSAVPVYTNYTKHEFDERRAPRYGPPKNLEASDTLPSVGALETSTPNQSEPDSMWPGNFDHWFEGATDSHQLRIESVTDEGLLNYLGPGYEASTELREYDENRAAGRIFSRQLMFERLPFPVDRYEGWVREQREGYFGPRTIEALLDKLEEQADDVIGRPAIAKYLFDTVDALRRAREHLSEENQMYNVLCEELEDALQNDESVAVFLPKRTWTQALETIAIRDGIIDEKTVEANQVAFVAPDSCRDLGAFNKLYILGPQRPQYAGFYVHPAVDETIVLTYQGNWEWMIQRDAIRFVEQQNNVVDGVDYEPYGKPQISILSQDAADDDIVESVDQEPSGAATPSASDAQASQSPSSGIDRGELTELFDQSRSVDYESGGSSRYDDYERKEYEILTKTGDQFTRRETVLRRRPSASTNQDRYHWISPRSLKSGDEIAILDDGVFERRWDEWLTEIYQEVHGETGVFDDLRTWYNTLSEILAAIADEGDVDSATHNTVRKAVERKTSHVDRRPSTVWRWFESVEAADDPLGLARDPALTIGPRRASDIDALGEAFNYEELTDENAIKIEENMSRIRTTNMKQGHKFREQLAEEMNTLKDTNLRDKTTIYEVESITEL